MHGFEWKGFAAVVVGAGLVAWATGDLLEGPAELLVLVGIALMASGAASLALRFSRARAEILERLDALEAGQASEASERPGQRL